MSLAYIDTIAPNSGDTVNISGSLFVSGTITLGDQSTDSVSFGADVSSSILPDASTTYDLGSASRKWRFVYGGTGSFDHLLGTPIVQSGLQVNGNITASGTGSFGLGKVSLENNRSKFQSISASGFISASNIDAGDVHVPGLVTGNSLRIVSAAFGTIPVSNASNPANTPLFVQGNVSASNIGYFKSIGLNLANGVNVSTGTISGSGFNIASTITAHTGSFSAGLIVNGGQFLNNGISVTGNISASGILSASTGHFSGLKVTGNITASGNIVGDGATIISGIATASFAGIKLGQNGNVTAGTISGSGFNIASTIEANTGSFAGIKLGQTSNVTAGTISGSGFNIASTEINAPAATITVATGSFGGGLIVNGGKQIADGVSVVGSISASSHISSSDFMLTNEHPKLTIQSNTAAGDQSLVFKSGDGSTMATIRADVTSNTLNQLSIGAGTNEEHLVVDANGKIGIGTKVPGQELSVVGNISGSGTGSFAGVGVNTAGANVTAGTISGSGFNISSTITGNTGSFAGGLIVNGGKQIADGVSVVGAISASGGEITAQSATIASSLSVGSDLTLNATSNVINSANDKIVFSPISTGVSFGQSDYPVTIKSNILAISSSITASSNISASGDVAASSFTLPLTEGTSQDLATSTQYTVNGSKVKVKAITAAQIDDGTFASFTLLNSSIAADSVVIGNFVGNCGANISSSIITVAVTSSNSASVFIHNETGGNISADTAFTASFVIL